MNSSQDDGWEVYGKKSKNRTGSNTLKQRGPQYSSAIAWCHSDTVQKLGLRSHGGQGRGSGQTYHTLSSDSRKHQSSCSGSAQSSEGSIGHSANAGPADNQASKTDEVDEESDDIDDTDDELLSDDFDSDESQKSHETRKKNRCFKELFQCLDSLTVEQINEPERQWHCPACKRGPGAIDWYRGLQPLLSHARTKRSYRGKLHKEFGEVLDEELRRRGTSAVPAGEIFGKWRGLEERADKEIVWPPMVVIRNTSLENDENDKRIGMGSQELLDYFSAYSAVKPDHSYGPQGHRGMSALIFEASAAGYVEAELLSKHFEDSGRGRLAWERNRVLFYPGGKRNLYGYMAEKEDMDDFNKHSKGKSKLKYEMRSYQEVFVNQVKQMSEDNQLLIWLKNQVAKEQKSKKALEEYSGLLNEKFRKTMEEIRELKRKTKEHHEQNKEEMDYQEQFFREQIEHKVTQPSANASPMEEHLHDFRADKNSEFSQLQDKEMEEFVNKKEKLMNAHEEQKLELERRYQDEKMALEKKFHERFNKLKEECTPTYPNQDDSQK